MAHVWQPFTVIRLAAALSHIGRRGPACTDCRLFRFAMHINYFGDIVLFSGFAMITHRAVVYIIPLAMTVNFIFIIIPALDRYLEKKYGAEFNDYARRTQKLVPLIY